MQQLILILIKNESNKQNKKTLQKLKQKLKQQKKKIKITTHKQTGGRKRESGEKNNKVLLHKKKIEWKSIETTLHSEATNHTFGRTKFNGIDVIALKRVWFACVCACICVCDCYVCD